MTHRFLIRPLATGDNAAMAAVIRRVMPEFGADGPGFAMHDAEVDRMYEAYAQPRCSYFVVELDGAVVGGGGVAPLEHAAPEVCELRKMYFLREARGIGAGTAMMQHCLDAARTHGFTRCYLETLTGMDAAQVLYKRTGFVPLATAMGGTGHFSCDRFYLLDL
ncbi:MAG: GNAT family N-acetyltransferase [Rhodanobacter sp.]